MVDRTQLSDGAVAISPQAVTAFASLMLREFDALRDLAMIVSGPEILGDSGPNALFVVERLLVVLSKCTKLHWSRCRLAGQKFV